MVGYDISSDITINMEEAQYSLLYIIYFRYSKYKGGIIFVVGYDISSDITINMKEAQYLWLYIKYFLMLQIWLRHNMGRSRPASGQVGA